jgi:hypothetical protein
MFPKERRTMPNSKFESPATLQADGTIQVGGRLTVDPSASGSDVEFRFMLVQGDLVVEGTGHGEGSGWVGTTAPGQASLQAGTVLAIGLAVLAMKELGRGYETFTWSEQIDLVNG